MEHKKDKAGSFWSIFFNPFSSRNESVIPTTQVNFSKVRRLNIGGFSAHKSSTPTITFPLRRSLSSSSGRKRQISGVQDGLTPFSKPRAHWEKAVGIGRERNSHLFSKAVDLVSDKETIELGPPTKKAKMDSRETPNGSLFNGDKDVEIVKIIDAKKALSYKNQLINPRFTLKSFRKKSGTKSGMKSGTKSILMLQEEKEDKQKFAELIQSFGVCFSTNSRKSIDRSGFRSRLPFVAHKPLTVDQNSIKDAPAVVDLSKEEEEEEEAAARNRVQVDRRRSVTPVTQATHKPLVPQRKSVTSVGLSKFLNSKPGHELAPMGSLSDWTESFSTRQKQIQEQIKKCEKKSALLSKLNRAKKEQKCQETIEVLSKQLFDYARVTESGPLEEEVEEIVPIPKLTEEMECEVNNALKGSPGEVLAEAFNLKILRRDIQTLRGLNWLNDEIINFFMNLLMDRGKHEKYPSVYAFNTFFYPRLISGGHSALKRWTKKVDIFSYDFVLAPVHLGVHWCMAIIEMRQKSVKYFDSMGGQNEQCLKALRQYLCDEMMDKKKEKLDLTDWEFICMKGIPQQENGSDCGMFSCMFAEYTTRKARITFTQKDMPNFRRIMIYEIIKVKLLC